MTEYTPNMSSADGIKAEIENFAQFVEDSNALPELENDDYDINVTYTDDAHTVYVQQGQYVIPVDGRTILLQEQGDYEQYVINNIEDAQEVGETTESDMQPIIYYTGELTDYSQILEDQTGLLENADAISEASIEEEHMHIAVPINSHAVAETEENSEEEEDESNIMNETERNGEQQPQYQYAILKNGKLHLQTLDILNSPDIDIVEGTVQQQQELQEQLAAFQQSISMDDTNAIDLEKITGRNLITGQTVTLDSYFNKLQERYSSTETTEKNVVDLERKKRRQSSKKPAPGAFLNKKVLVGTTTNGKRIVGKILHVYSTGNKDKIKMLNEQTDAGEKLDESTQIEDPKDAEPVETPDPEEILATAVIKKQVVLQGNYDHNVGKTLAGLMNLQTVSRKLQKKNLAVKIVEKVFSKQTGVFGKTVSYVYGHMENVKMDNDENTEQKLWVFVNRYTNPFAKSIGISETVESNSSDAENDNLNSAETISLTIVITVDQDGRKSTRVNLNPNQPSNRCHICKKGFKTPILLQKHFQSVHLNEKQFVCEFCNKICPNHIVLQKHQKLHTGERSYQCTQCEKSFNTAGSLKRHVTIHDPSLRPLECTVCVQRFTDESSLRKHLLIHTGIRAYACEICNKAFVNQGDLNFHRRIHDPVKQFSCEFCGREFSRHSNLMRHAQIHRGKGALHNCDICGCSYSFVSSLTRHIVQKHIGQQQQ